MDDRLLGALRDVCEKVDDALWSSFIRTKQAPFTPSHRSRLLFPVYSGSREGKLRVSEQEARFAFVESLAGSPFLYSVETPTRRAYRQTGAKGLSAQTDLTLYDRWGNHLLDVEFKSKGASASAKSKLSVSKDVEKLLREPGPGMWFHLFERVNNTSLPKLFQLITDEMRAAVEAFPDDVEAKKLVFHICVLEHGFSAHKVLYFDPIEVGADGLSRFFRFEYRVSRLSLQEISDQNEWQCHHRENPPLSD